MLDGFEDFYSYVDLEGCDSPKVFDFERELRLPGDYIIAARLKPSGQTVGVPLEVR